MLMPTINKIFRVAKVNSPCGQLRSPSPETIVLTQLAIYAHEEQIANYDKTSKNHDPDGVVDCLPELNQDGGSDQLGWDGDKVRIDCVPAIGK